MWDEKWKITSYKRYVENTTIQYNTIRLYFTTLATHNKSWFPGGASVNTLHYNKVRYTCIQNMKSVRSSRRHGKRRGKFVFEIRQRLCGLCLIGKIVPEHCTTILKATLQKICVWPWKLQISLDIPKIAIYVSIIEFYKGVAQLGGVIYLGPGPLL